MTDKILVTYATRYGSTQEVAQAVAEVLREAGLAVDVHPVGDVRRLDDYEAVVLGAALYMFRWHSDAHHFLSAHHDALAQRPVAIFALGPLSSGGDDWQDAREHLHNELARYAWLTPVALELFGGRIAPDRVTFPWKFFFREVPPGDYRDWEAIRAWAKTLPAKLGQPVRPLPAN